MTVSIQIRREDFPVNLDDPKLAFEYLDNANKIRKYIFDNHYHNPILREYYHNFPKTQPEISGMVEETILEKIVNSRNKTSALVELFGISLSPDREKQRDELMVMISNINRKTRDVLEQLNRRS
jgi:hypothetical protein